MLPDPPSLERLFRSNFSFRVYTFKMWQNFLGMAIFFWLFAFL